MASESSNRRIANAGSSLCVLLDLSEAVISDLKSEKLFSTVTRRLKNVLHHEFSQLYLFDPLLGELRTRAIHFPGGKGLVKEGMVIPIKNTPAGWVFTTHRPMRMNRPDSLRSPIDIVDRLLAEGVRAGCCVPIACRGHVLGVLSVGSRSEAAFSQDHERLLCSIADQFGAAIEKGLVKRVCDGEMALFHELVWPYEREMDRIVYSILKDPADTEEVAQEALLKAMTRIHQLKSSDSFGGWLIQIAVNEARMRKRKYRRSLYDSLDEPQERFGASAPIEGLPDHRPIPSEAVEQQEVRRTLTRALWSLPAIYRNAFVLQEIEQLSSRSTAALLDVSIPAVKTRAHRARLRLKSNLSSTALSHANS